MRHILICLCALSFAANAASQSLLESLETELKTLARKVTPAVVAVEGGALVPSTTNPPPIWLRPPDESTRRAFEALRLLNLPSPVSRKGSGFVVGSDGWILTGADVVRGAVQCTVRLADGRKLTGRVVSIDDTTNLAMVKVSAQGLNALPLGDSDKLEPGSMVLCAGTQGGYERSFALCLVAGRDRTGVIGQQQFLANLLQIAGPVGPGSSGAVLINARGEGVGIIVASIAPGVTFQPSTAGASTRPGTSSSLFIGAIPSGASGGGLAVPINDVVPVLKEMQEGKVRRAYFGIVPADAEEREGAEVLRVIENSPAAKAGVRLGDVITAMNGQPVKRAADISTRLRRMKPGETLTIAVLRGQQRLNITVRLGEK